MTAEQIVGQYSMGEGEEAKMLLWRARGSLRERQFTGRLMSRLLKHNPQIYRDMVSDLTRGICESDVSDPEQARMTEGEIK